MSLKFARCGTLCGVCGVVGRNLGLVDAHSVRGADLVEHLRSAVIMEKTMIIVQNIKVRVRGKDS